MIILPFLLPDYDDRQNSIQNLNHPGLRCELKIKKTKIHWDLNQGSQSGQILNQGRYDWVGVIGVIRVIGRGLAGDWQVIRVIGIVIRVIEIPYLGDSDSIFLPITSVISISITHRLYPASDTQSTKSIMYEIGLRSAYRRSLIKKAIDQKM